MKTIATMIKDLINRGCDATEAKCLVYGDDLILSREEKIIDNNNRINVLVKYGYSIEEAKEIIHICED